MAHLAAGILAVSSQLTFSGLAATPPASARATLDAQACSPAQQLARLCAVTPDGLQVTLPQGTQPCPRSGVGAACTAEGDDAVATGVASTPEGHQKCPSDGLSPITGSPAACDYPNTAADQQLSLRVDRTALPAGQKVLLTATAGSGVAAVGVAIEIFDTSTGALLGACAHGIRCAVAYQAAAGVHDFVAYLTAPAATAPADLSAVRSNTVSVGWIGLAVHSDNPVVGPGKSVTVRATSSIPVERFGYALEIFDAGTMDRISYCGQGTTCTVSLTQQSSGARSVVAAVGDLSSRLSDAGVLSVSDRFNITWLAVTMSATSALQVGSAIHLSATTNADLTDTPWSIGLFDDQGRLLAKPCKTGDSCSADVSARSGKPPRFFAAIGSVPVRSPDKLSDLFARATGPSLLTNIQARSDSVEPARILWGVDSCKAFTGDPTGEVYPGVAAQLGAPDFWGRYLTSTVCPGLSRAEIYMARKLHMGILPIYNDYDCSAVAGYDTGKSYAQAATAVAAEIGIPRGRVLAIDIEPPGAACPGAAGIDSGFIRGWYEGVRHARYVPVFYGNGTSGSQFAAAWCAAQSQANQISRNSYIWSFEPSLVSRRWSKADAPVWQPEETGCPDFVAAWQYQLGSHSRNPDVDHDEALSTLPLWYP